MNSGLPNNISQSTIEKTDSANTAGRLRKKANLAICVIGLGVQNTQNHIPALSNSDNAELCAVVDSDPDKVFNWAQELNVPGFLSVEQMLLQISPDAAIVAVPHDQYLPIIANLAAKGISVLKEKPLARSLCEANDIIRLVSSSNIKLMVAVQRRFRTTSLMFQEYVKLIGTPRFIEVRYTVNVGTRSEGWRAIKNTSGGGCLIDMGYHMIDLLVWYFGLPDAVAASFSCKAFPDILYEAEDMAFIVANYKASGLACNIVISDCLAPKSESLLLMGTEGSLALQRDSLILFDRNMVESQRFDTQLDNLIADQLEHFIQVVQGKVQNHCAPENHLQHVAFIDACYLSALRQKFIDPHDLINAM